MFNKKIKRYMTRHSHDMIHPEIATHLWKVICHRQEVPKDKETWVVGLRHTAPVTMTIWCVDQGDHQLMMLPEEY